MRIILLIILASSYLFPRVVEVIDKRNFNFESFNFTIGNDGSLFYSDSSKTGFFNKADSMQYINDAGIILTGYSKNGEKSFISNVKGISKTKILPGIASNGSGVNFILDSTNKEKYMVYHSLDYDEKGEPLFGEQIPKWPLYSQKREIDSKSKPMYLDNENDRNSKDLFDAFFIGFEDIFSIYKMKNDDNLIQVENLVSLFENQIICSYKLINYGEAIDSCLLSFYIDPDISHNERIFEELYDDKIELNNQNNQPLIYNKNDSSDAKMALSLSTARYPSIENLELGEAFSGGETSDKYYIFSGYNLTQSFVDLRNYQLQESNEVPDYIGDTRLLLNGESFNFPKNDTIFVAYSINMNELKENKEENHLEIAEQAKFAAQLFDNILTGVATNPDNIEMNNFDIFDLNGKLIEKNASNINNLNNDKYLLVDKNNLENTKKILIDK